MSKKRDFRDYLHDILISIDSIQEFIAGMTQDQFLQDKKTRDAVVRNLEIIGEAVNKLPQDIQDKYPQASWREIVSMRNKMIHEYFGIDFEIVWQTMHEDLEPLKQTVKKIISGL